MEAEYTSIRLSELVTREFISCFDFLALCDMHRYIFKIFTSGKEKEEL